MSPKSCYKAMSKCYCYLLRFCFLLQFIVLEIFQLLINQKLRKLSVLRNKESSRTFLVILDNFYLQFSISLAFYMLNIIFTVRIDIITFEILEFYSAVL